MCHAARLLLGLGAMLLGLSTPTLACPGKDDSGAHAAVHHGHGADPTACAKRAALVGSACSYSTGMMASRVLEQGKDFSYTGTLQKADAPLASKVAAPYTIGPDAIRVIANEVLEGADLDARATWTGKTLEVDGVVYFVLTSVTDQSS